MWQLEFEKSSGSVSAEDYLIELEGLQEKLDEAWEDILETNNRLDEGDKEEHSKTSTHFP